MNKIHLKPETLQHLYFDEGLSQRTIADRLGVTQYAVSARMREFGFKTRPKHCKLSRQKYFIDSTCLDEVTPKSAWILGWFVSDGFVSKKENYFGIKLAPRDASLLSMVKQYFQYSGPILDAKSKLKGSKKIYRCKLLKMSSAPLRERLIELGVRPAKTGKETYLDCIDSPELDRAFIQGIYEGDGSLLRYPSRMKFQIVGTWQLLSAIQTKLIEYIGVNKTKLHCHSRSKNHYMLQYSGCQQVPRIADWIYSGSTMRLKRKYDVYMKMRSA